MTLHLPILRWGEPYRSLDEVAVPACDGGVAATMSQANPGLIRRDLRRAGEVAAALEALPLARWLDLAAEAGRRFIADALPCGDEMQSPERYVELTSRTSGLPHAMVRGHMAKVEGVLVGLGPILRGLCGGLDPASVLDAPSGAGAPEGAALLRFARRGAALGIVLPSNAPGVNGVWLPALPLRYPVLLKPGRADPWTPLRIVQAFVAAGAPREAFGFYPTTHEGADVLLRQSGCGLVFGGAEAVRRYAALGTVEIHGPGRSKVVVGPDAIGGWPAHLEAIVESVLANAGRSCICASTLLVPAEHATEGRALADALARRLGPIAPLPPEHPDARISAFADPAVARALDRRIEDAIAAGGVEDLAAAYRSGPRLAALDGASYLRPTVLRVDDPAHPLAATELPFPFVAVVAAPSADLARAASGSLVVTALTRDHALLDALGRDPTIDRLHMGPRPTTRIDWSQPHEGNLFELCYRRRAIQRAAWEPVG